MVMTRPFMRSGREKFGIDRYDPTLVLFLPLWYPGVQLDVSKSLDINGHTCTKTGVLWTPQGGSFDGIDDTINAGTSSVLSPNAFTMIAWYKPPTASPIGTLIHWKATGSIPSIGAGQADSNLWVYLGTSNYRYFTHGMSANTFYQFAVTVPGNANADISSSRAFKNGVELAAVGTVATGAQGAKVTTYIGGNPDLLTNGVIGEILLYNRVLTPLEIQQIYLATKFRYQ